jgi:steroid 5-alpha reductase family enzyme
VIWLRVAEAWALAACLQLVLWLVQQRTKNAGIVDVGWAGAFSLVVALFAFRTTAPLESWLPIAMVVIVWSGRLTSHLIGRGAASSPEEGRYAELRKRWGERASVRFFVFFQAQAALVGVLSTAFVVPFFAAPRSELRWIGIAVSLIGIVGETIADLQLTRFKRVHPGKVCDVGLWSWSRHPNYFFEWCVWIGYAVYGLVFGAWGLIALVPQAIIIASIFGVTGIPPTEAQAIRSKGDAYRDYQKRVSRFIPMPPKPRGNDV